MPFFFVFVGVLLIVTGIKNTHAALGKQLVKDFTGEQSFWTWVVAIGAVGSLGYIERLRPFANMFLVLILLAMVLSNSKRGDILTAISDGLKNPVKPGDAASGEKSSSITDSPKAVTSGKIDLSYIQGAAEAARKAAETTPGILQQGMNLLSAGAKVLSIFGF